MVPADLIERWEAAYRRYCDVSSVATVRITARAMAVASRDVAIAWRQISLQTGLPWWTLAAVGSAAQAFELQAGEFFIHADQTVDHSELTAPLSVGEPRW
jgi:hypothetical protein